MFETKRKRAEESVSEAPEATPSTRHVQRSSEPSAALSLVDAIIQAKMTVGPAGDRYEREADAVASRVVRSLSAQRSTSAGTDQQTAVAVQRIQRSGSIGAQGGDVDQDTERGVKTSVGGGAPLPTDVRSRLEPAFGADFSSVRIHQGSQATALNDRIQAKAFTTGNDIFFRDGLPDTTTSAGQHLLAHELTHTIQQDGAAGGVALQRKGGGKGGGKKGSKKSGKQGGKKGGGAKGGAPRQPVPKKELSEAELAARAEQQRIAAEKAAAKRAEAERLAAEQEAERLAAENAARVERAGRGRRVWNGLEKRLLAAVPGEVRKQTGADGKVVFTRTTTFAMMASEFADLKLRLETGDFDPGDTDEELIGDQAEIDEQWDTRLWEQVGGLLGTNVPTKTTFFAHLGWPTVSGLKWDMKACGLGPSKEKIHLTLSGNSMAAPQTIVGQDPQALERSPASIFDALFMGIDNDKRVHCTRESEPKKHLYLGGRNGLGMVMKGTDWDGDAQFMLDQLDAFRTDAIAKIVTAKSKGWKI